jgi:hypothetical protein
MTLGFGGGLLSEFGVKTYSLNGSGIYAIRSYMRCLV